MVLPESFVVKSTKRILKADVVFVYGEIVTLLYFRIIYINKDTDCVNYDMWFCMKHDAFFI